MSGSLPGKEKKHLNYFDSKRLLKELYDNISTMSLSHYLILLGLISGMRFAEMVGLTRSDFNFDTGEIKNNKSWGYIKKMHDGFGSTKKRAIKLNNKNRQEDHDHLSKLF